MADPARPLAELMMLPAAPATSAEDQKRAFLRLMSHELRTPLNSILGFSEILAGELYGPLGAPQYKEYAEIVRGSGQKLLELINQLLELARLECGLGDLEPRAEPLGAAVEEVVEQLQTERRVRIARPDGACTAFADPRGLRTVLGNVIGNALAASPPDAEVLIQLRVAGAWTEIDVRDAGPFVHEDDLARLLRPFEKTE
ncbi:HAMP domain-containing sensor histidine kinase, partial [Phenylobacterium sp.]|uniref:sensor histidine kinase n=1 Tax=Phenylobacterium sp. TaxID=1871053 RepID=UPI002E348F29